MLLWTLGSFERAKVHFGAYVATIMRVGLHYHGPCARKLRGPKHPLVDSTFQLEIGPKLEGCFLWWGSTRFGAKVMPQSTMCHFLTPHPHCKHMDLSFFALDQ